MNRQLLISSPDTDLRHPISSSSASLHKHTTQSQHGEGGKGPLEAIWSKPLLTLTVRNSIIGSVRKHSWKQVCWGREWVMKDIYICACMHVHVCACMFVCAVLCLWSFWLKPMKAVWGNSLQVLSSEMFFFLTGFKHAQRISETRGKHRAVSDYICSPGHLQSKHWSPNEKYNYYPLLDISSHCLTTELHI